jgi:hypothetical protein
VPIELIQAGGEYIIEAGPGGGTALRLVCADVHQRNWSRVANGTLANGDGRVVACFVKQYVGKDGFVHADHWEYEREGVEYAADILGQIVRVPKLLLRDKRLVLNVFEYFEIVSIDQLLRSDPAALNRSIDFVLQRMEQVLVALLSAPEKHDVSGLKSKQRGYGRLGVAVNFKGFEIRNAGMPCSAGTGVSAGELVLFDFVRPYLAPIEEAAAKLFVSVGMLNWGNPISRFIKGPDTALLARAADILRPWLDRGAIAAELDLQEKFRNAELKGARDLEVFLKWLGVMAFGRYYFARLRAWCAKNI